MNIYENRYQQRQMEESIMVIYDKNKAEAPNNANLDKEERMMDSFILYGIIDMLKEDINRQKEKIKDCEERIKKMSECDLEEPMKDKYMKDLDDERDSYSSNMSASRRSIDMLRSKIKNGRGISNIIDMNGHELLPLLERILRDTVE